MKGTGAAIVMVTAWVLVAACAATQQGAARPAPSPIDSTAAALDSLARRPPWLFPDSDCPADAFPGAQKPVDYTAEACTPDLKACLQACEAGEGNACYAAALRAQEVKAPRDDAEALFSRACRLGIASGCTNRAAGMLLVTPQAPGAQACANRTFQAMCERDDPWACTMWGNALVRGEGIAQDLARALEILPKGCRLGEDDEACVQARQVIKEIEAAQAGAHAPP